MSFLSQLKIKNRESTLRINPLLKIFSFNFLLYLSFNLKVLAIESV